MSEAEKSIVQVVFEESEISVHFDDDGNPLFPATQVCTVLGFTNPHKAISDHVEKDDLTKREAIDSLGRKQTINLITESGLYSLAFQSKLPKAKAFARWVTKEVLPSIRKTGSYGEQNPLAIQISDLDPRLRFTLMRMGMVHEKPAAWEELFPMDFRKRIWRLDGKEWDSSIPSPAGVLPKVYRDIYTEMFGKDAYDAIKGMSVNDSRYHQILTEPMREEVSKELKHLMGLANTVGSVDELISTWKTFRDPTKNPRQLTLFSLFSGAVKRLTKGSK